MILASVSLAFPFWPAYLTPAWINPGLNDLTSGLLDFPDFAYIRSGHDLSSDSTTDTNKNNAHSQSYPYDTRLYFASWPFFN